MGGRPLLRRGLLGGSISLGALSAAHAQSPSIDYAVFTEFSPQNKKLLPGWNRRIFTDTDSRKGSSIQCDFETGIVSLAPGTYHLSGLSIVAYDSSTAPPEMTTTRSPAAAGYCRLRRLAGDPGPEQIGLRDIDNADPSVICIGSPSSANLAPSVFEAFCEAEQPTRLLLEHQAGSNPQDILLRVFVANSKWHAVARLAIRRLP